MWFDIRYVSNLTNESNSFYLFCERGENIMTMIVKTLQMFLFEEVIQEYTGDRESLSEIINFLIRQGHLRDYQRAESYTSVSQIINAIAPEYLVHDRWWIEGVELSTNQCDDCILNRTGQESHTVCSTGCLHNLATCFIPE